MATRVLYVEDEEAARFIVQEQLRTEGYEVTVAADGVEATEILDRETFEVVLLDIKMPRKDGLEVLRYMREKKIRPRVIMLTAVDEMSIAITAMKLGAIDYVTKPFSLDALLACIKRVLSR
jgi:DNA-binding response OmpR family regulator